MSEGSSILEPSLETDERPPMGHATGTVFVEANKRNLDQAQIIAAAVVKAADQFMMSDVSLEWAGSSQRPLTTRAAAKNWLDTNDEDINDSHSVIIPCVSEANSVSKTVKKSLSLTHDELVKLNSRGGVYSLSSKVAALFPDQEVISYKVTKSPARRKAVAEATKGKAVTKYGLYNPEWNQLLSTWDTQTEARAEGLRLLNEPGTNVSQLSVEAVVIRDTGNKSLVNLSRPNPESGTVVVEVTVESVKPGASVHGWLVAFDYHF
jgi:hypothetical protein